MPGFLANFRSFIIPPPPAGVSPCVHVCRRRRDKPEVSPLHTRLLQFVRNDNGRPREGDRGDEVHSLCLPAPKKAGKKYPAKVGQNQKRAEMKRTEDFTSNLFLACGHLCKTSHRGNKERMRERRRENSRVPEEIYFAGQNRRVTKIPPGKDLPARRRETTKGKRRAGYLLIIAIYLETSGPSLSK